MNSFSLPGCDFLPKNVRRFLDVFSFCIWGGQFFVGNLFIGWNFCYTSSLIIFGFKVILVYLRYILFLSVSDFFSLSGDLFMDLFAHFF